MGNCLSAHRNSKAVHIPDAPSPANTEPVTVTPTLSSTLPTSTQLAKPPSAIHTTPPTSPSTTTVPTTLAPTPPIMSPSSTPTTATTASSRTLPVSVPPLQPTSTVNTARPTLSTTTVSTTPLSTQPVTPSIQPTNHTNTAQQITTATLAPTAPVTLQPNPPPVQPKDHAKTIQLSTTTHARVTTLPPNDPKYTVFISHAGEDKATIAIPLREKLGRRGITAFVDEVDMPPGTDSKKAMVDAMETADVAVIILSPEFVAREWPMRELMCFLRRREECAAQGGTSPIVIPCFYRLRIDELYGEPRLDRRDKEGNLLYQRSRFMERQKSGELEASIPDIQAALRAVHGLMGVRNDWEASNEPSLAMAKRREMLLQELSDSIGRAVLGGVVIQRSTFQSVNEGLSQAPVDRYRKFLPPLLSGVQAVLDFASKDKDGSPMTPEGWVKHHLLEERSGSAQVVSIHGIGGVGKSTIIRALSVHFEIQQRFVDGVHIITLGKDASSATLFREICQVLKDSGAEKTSETVRMQNDVNEALHCFEKWFNGRRCAFLIDDVWVHRVGFDLVSRLCNVVSGVSGNCVVFTTREHEVAALAPRQKTVRVEPRQRRGEDARRILFFHADVEDTNDFSPAVDDSINGILDICDGLPVSLAAAGKNVKILSMDMPNDGAWNQFRSELVSCRERLLRENVKGYGNLFATFATSISILDQQPRQEVLGFASALSFAKMYRRFCVLRKQAGVPMGMLKNLWEVESDERAKRIARKFVEAGLASRRFARAGEDYLQDISLHDSLHDFAVAEAERHDDIREAHDCLLKGYSSLDAEICCDVEGTLKWWSPRLKEDGYIHRNVCRHLVGAGRDRELVALLLSPLWTKRQLEVNDILFLEDDFTLGIRAVQECMRDASDAEGCDLERALRLISECLNLSSGYVMRNLAELWFQVSGRLIRYAEDCSALQDYLRRIERDGEKPMVVCKNSFLTEPGQGNTRIFSVGVEVNCIEVLNDGGDVACGVDDGRILVVNVKRGVQTKEWPAHDSSVLAISSVPGRTRLVSGSWDRTAKVWDVESCCCVAVFRGHTHAVISIAVMGDERRVISGSYDGTARVWEMETGQAVSTPFTEHDGPVECVAVLADETGVVTGGSHDKLRLWNATTGELVDDSFDRRSCFTSCIAVTPDGRRIAIESRDELRSVLRIWDVNGHQLIGSSLLGPTGWVRCMALSGDGRRAVYGSVDFTIRVLDMVSGTEICNPLTGHTRSVTGVAFPAGSDRIVSSSWDQTVRVWDARRKTINDLTNWHSSAVDEISFSPDGEFVLTKSSGELRIWNTTSGKEVANPLPVDTREIKHMTLISNGRMVATIRPYDQEMLCVWDLKSSKPLYTLTGHAESVEYVAERKQGERAIAGFRGKTGQLWDRLMDCDHFVLEGHTAEVAKVFVTDDGFWIASVDRNDNIFVWDFETRNFVYRFKKEQAQLLPRRWILNSFGEPSVDDVKQSNRTREFVYGEDQVAMILATVESDISRWALSPDKKTICVGLHDGHVGLMKLEGLEELFLSDNLIICCIPRCVLIHPDTAFFYEKDVLPPSSYVLTPST